MSAVAQRLGYSYHSKVLRKAFCITSYFRKPEQGVHNWEELSRSSAFFIRSNLKRVKYHIVSAAHVTHPFLYPRLYPEEFPRFLSYLKESDVKVALQYRQEDTGVLLKEFDLRKELSVRVDSDLVVGHLQHEDEFESIMLSKFGMVIDPLELYMKPHMPNTAVEIIGHDFSTNANGQVVLVPVTLPGRILGASAKRAVVDTPQPSVMGLCGGPAIILDSDGFATRFLAGMVEGRIQRTTDNIDNHSEVEMNQALADRTVLVSAPEISDFLKTVEEELKDNLDEKLEGASFLPFPPITGNPVPEVANFTETALPPSQVEEWDPNAAKPEEVDF
jgi:hypothetical protein